VRGLARGILAVLAIAACGSPQAGTTASPSPSSRPSASASASPSTDPSLVCTSKPVPGHPLALLAATLLTSQGLAVMDVADPLHPFQICGLNNATSGRFVSATKIVFWDFTFVGTADLITNSVNWSRAFVDAPTVVAFSPDGSKWAYQTGDPTHGLTIHLVIAGKDETLLTMPQIIGTGVPPWGPLNKVAFSAQGDYLLTYTAFGSPSGLPNFVVFRSDGSVAFRSALANLGTWSSTGNRLYLLAATTVAGIIGRVGKWEPGSAPVQVSGPLSSYFWPAVSPDDGKVVFNSFDAKSLPRLWRLDIATGKVVQISSGISTEPVFVSRNVVWSSEERPCQCGPGGSSAPDGKVVAHDLQSGADTLVADFTGFTLSQAPTRDILDVWLG
jgi:hypothetical protein